MATQRVAKPAPSRRTTDHAAFVRRLVALGCVYCPECTGYAWRDHTTHVDLVGDWRAASMPAYPYPVDDTAGAALVMVEAGQ